MYICAFRKQRTTEFALVNLVFMDWASLHVGKFRKEKWYFACTISVSVHLLKHLHSLGLNLHSHPDKHYYVGVLIISMSISRLLSIVVSRLGAVLRILGRHGIGLKEKIAM